MTRAVVKKTHLISLGILLVFGLGGCVPVPEVPASREVLWGQFGGKPVDALLMTWGSPMGETHLTDGSRLIEYQHSTIYDAQSVSERRSGCKVSFLAKSPKFVISDVAMQGEPYECELLSQGKLGEARIMAAPAPYVYYPPPYHRYAF